MTRKARASEDEAPWEEGAKKEGEEREERLQEALERGAHRRRRGAALRHTRAHRYSTHESDARTDTQMTASRFEPAMYELLLSIEI